MPSVCNIGQLNSQGNTGRGRGGVNTDDELLRTDPGTQWTLSSVGLSHGSGCFSDFTHREINALLGVCAAGGQQGVHERLRKGVGEARM